VSVTLVGHAVSATPAAPAGLTVRVVIATPTWHPAPAKRDAPASPQRAGAPVGPM